MIAMVPVPPAATPFVWTSDDPAVADITDVTNSPPGAKGSNFGFASATLNRFRSVVRW